MNPEFSRTSRWLPWLLIPFPDSSRCQYTSRHVITGWIKRVLCLNRQEVNSLTFISRGGWFQLRIYVMSSHSDSARLGLIKRFPCRWTRFWTVRKLVRFESIAARAPLMIFERKFTHVNLNLFSSRHLQKQTNVYPPFRLCICIHKWSDLSLPLVTNWGSLQ